MLIELCQYTDMYIESRISTEYVMLKEIFISLITMRESYFRAVANKIKS